MSRIGKQQVKISSGVEVKFQDRKLEIKGPKGTLSLDLHADVDLEIKNDEIIVKNAGVTKKSSAIWGLTRALISNMVQGTSEGYKKQLELQGVGFRMAVQGKKINMALGFSHPIIVEVPEGLEAKIEENNVLLIAGADKQLVGQFAANIRKLKKAEPYKGKGFRYVGEHVRRKAGKKAAATAK